MVDTIAPIAPVINAVTGDDIVNAVEAGAGFNVTGTGTAGDTITLTNEAGAQIGDPATVDGDGNWSVAVDADDVTAMGEGDETLTATATDAAGNLPSASSTVDIVVDTIAPIIARDDTDNLELELRVETTVPIDQENFTLLGALGGSDGTDSNLGFKVGESTNGTVNIEVKQTALLQVADAISLEIYDNNNQLLYIAANENNPLLGNALGLEVLGLTNNADGLTATVSGLEPGDYKIVVRKDESLLTSLVNDLTLAELGESGVVLGPNNQTAILDAVEDSLNSGFPFVLGTTVRGALELALNLTTDIGVGEFLGIAQPILIGLGASLDPLLDAVASEALSNTLTLLETTDVTATLTQYSFANDTVVTGNVINPDPLATEESGEDTVNTSTILTMIASSNNSNSVPTATQLNGVDALSVIGEYGVLIINEKGEYTYVANGDYASSGQSDTFTYTIFDGFTSDTADLVIDLGFTIDMAGGDDIVNITNNIVQSSLVELDGLNDSANTINLDSALNVSIIGGDGVDTINLTGSSQTLSLSDIFQTEVLDISGTGANTLLVQTADIANSGVSSPIYVKGDSDDTVDLEGDSWSNVGQTASEGETYNVWQAGSDISTQIYIDTDITNII